ncbi:Fibroblast growth factor homolog [Eumeta japonica]|uniref:Fibroblast growth factor homolog n=1 Tax=Eumeta variegata TaxID=151549 RepID=A0A4C1ZZK6_EUMVA|nr:Fibroblast growth factor homolog [Eumeta japonica]
MLEITYEMTIETRSNRSQRCTRATCMDKLKTQVGTDPPHSSFHYGTERALLFQKDLSDDCMFDEHIEENNYNTYSRLRAGKKTFLALDNRGRARRTQIPAARPLGNLAPYALTLTRRWQWAGPRSPVCPARRHRAKLKRPPPFHRNCQKRLKTQKGKRRHPKKRRQPKARRRPEQAQTTTDRDWDESTTPSTSTDAEFFRWGSAHE